MLVSINLLADSRLNGKMLSDGSEFLLAETASPAYIEVKSFYTQTAYRVYEK